VRSAAQESRSSACSRSLYSAVSLAIGCTRVSANPQSHYVCFVRSCDAGWGGRCAAKEAAHSKGLLTLRFQEDAEPSRVSANFYVTSVLRNYNAIKLRFEKRVCEVKDR
jgi:hypothetical protein